MEPEMAEQEANKKTIDNYKADYYYFTGKASEIVRSLSLAGIAVVWIFKVSGEKVTLAHELLYTLKWFITALALDLLQYVIGSLIWYFYYMYLEEKIKRKIIEPDEDVKAPQVLPIIINIIFILKITATVVAYIVLLKYLASIIEVS